MSVVEEYLAALRRIRASGGGTGERSYHSPLTNLLNAIGSPLKTKECLTLTRATPRPPPRDPRSFRSL